MHHYHCCIIDASQRQRQQFTNIAMHPFNWYYHAALLPPSLSFVPPSFFHCIQLPRYMNSMKRSLDRCGNEYDGVDSRLSDNFDDSIRRHHQQQTNEESCIEPVKKPWSLIPMKRKKKEQKKQHSNQNDKEQNRRIPKIAIIGGGLCGITAAKSIVERLSKVSGPKEYTVDITIYEADVNSPNGRVASGTSCGSNEESEDKELHEETKPFFAQPKWKAAAARNANSLVPGASMHIMSQRSTVFRIMKDHIGIKPAVVFTKGVEDDFSEVPPYFGFNVWRCIGLSVPWEERFSFFQFMYHFLKTSLFSTNHDVKLRGKYLVQIANANTHALSKDLLKADRNSNLNERLGLSSGFISVHRTREKAVKAVLEAEDFGEVAEVLSLEDAIALEPKVQHLPFKCFFVHRPNDKTANCLEYLNEISGALLQAGVKYYNCLGDVTTIERFDPASQDGRFKVRTAKGSEGVYDYIILASGVSTPKIMLKLGIHAGCSCPTYPLKGYSLTLSAPTHIGGKTRGGDYLTRSMSFDNIYCTSLAGKGMVRLAGFGEIAGFPHGKDFSKRSTNTAAGVLHRYASAIFGRELNSSPDLVKPCFRPLSPDDLPLVGRVKAIPGLFLHHGHGTLGWTMSLATAECLAQDICEEIEGIDKKPDFFILSNGTTLPKAILSPDRFLYI